VVCFAINGETEKAAVDAKRKPNKWEENRRKK
jgi:hypothetical protein